MGPEGEVRAVNEVIGDLLPVALGVVVVLAAVTLVCDPVDGSEPSDPSTLASVKVALGALAVQLARSQWRHRPAGL